jgi:hypothetical protein
MSTDYELLKVVAKAIGHEETKVGERGWFYLCTYQDNPKEWELWNPLNDDGDCARIETILEIELQWHDNGVQAGKRGNPVGVFCFYSDHGGDKNAARRQASVEFAAAIGEAL